jgi:SPP1 gp7 family putative phage head morphogenesis protein
VSESQTANQAYTDAALRHQVDIRRYTAGEIKQIRKLMLEQDRELVRLLRARLADIGLPAGRDDLSVRRLRSLLADVRVARSEMLRALQQDLLDNLDDFAPLEVEVERQNLETTIPIELQVATVSIKRARAIIRSSPFQGQLLSKWFDQLEAGDAARLERAVVLGVQNGETLDQILRRIVGTRAANYQDGALSITRRNAEAVARTAINHISNEARAEVWAENADLLEVERWTATLDGRTSAICRARDGTVYPVGVGPRPPAHFNCRSVMVAVLSRVGIVGERPYVVDTRTPDKRRVDFKQEARDKAGDSWRTMSEKERSASIARIRNAWADANVGQVAASTTYQEFLSRQSAAFQDQVLGKTKGKLFRQGGLTLQDFVDRAGNELTLSQLKSLYPDAWSRAGL